MYVREIQEMAEASLSTTKCNRNDDHIVSSGKMNVSKKLNTDFPRQWKKKTWHYYNFHYHGKFVLMGLVET